MQTDTVVDRKDPAYAGQAGYTPMALKAYDVMVYRFTGPLLWRCGKQEFLDFYNEQVSAHHLDVGVASGALLDQCRFPDPKPDLTLMDLNPNSLAFAARRLQRYSPQTHQANVLDPWQLPPARFESVAMTNILHCVPGTIREKAVAFDHARDALVPEGTLFGATILAKGVDHTPWSRAGMRWLNRRGAFTNLDDSYDDLNAALADRFASHRIDVHGTIAMFVAKSAG